MRLELKSRVQVQLRSRDQARQHAIQRRAFRKNSNLPNHVASMNARLDASTSPSTITSNHLTIKPRNPNLHPLFLFTQNEPPRRPFGSFPSRLSPVLSPSLSISTPLAPRGPLGRSQHRGTAKRLNPRGMGNFWWPFSAGSKTSAAVAVRGWRWVEKKKAHVAIASTPLRGRWWRREKTTLIRAFLVDLTAEIDVKGGQGSR